jgi:hypothetical protein
VKRRSWRIVIASTAVPVLAAVVVAIPQPASARTVTACTVWSPFAGTCTTDAIQASSSTHAVDYSIDWHCGWGNIEDVDSHQRVGGSNLSGTGSIHGLYGRYALTIRDVGCVPMFGSLGTG